MFVAPTTPLFCFLLVRKALQTGVNQTPKLVKLRICPGVSQQRRPLPCLTSTLPGRDNGISAGSKRVAVTILSRDERERELSYVYLRAMNLVRPGHWGIQKFAAFSTGWESHMLSSYLGTLQYRVGCRVDGVNHGGFSASYLRKHLISHYSKLYLCLLSIPRVQSLLLLISRNGYSISPCQTAPQK